MRKIVFFLSVVTLAAVVAARVMLPEASPAWEAMAVMADSESYNILALDLPVTTETAGSAIIAEMNSYYLSRTPTAKGEYTGLWEGKNLILIWAENWRPIIVDEQRTPGLYRLRSEGADISCFYAPDWYQAGDGREFALLAGLTPTTVRNKTSLTWVGEQDVYLPYTAARCLAGAGYTCMAVPKEAARDEVYEALGFDIVGTASILDENTVRRTLPSLLEGGPFFVYYVWDGKNGEDALSCLMDILAEQGGAEDTAVCLLAGSREELRGSLYLWGPGLTGAQVDIPCSELDVTPTLLNLFGVDYDSRFLSGRDMLAPAGAPDAAGSAMPLVTLYGSAYSDWVTEAGCYLAGENTFIPASEYFAGDQEAARYVQQVRRLVYDRYVYPRRVMENNYFQIVLKP